MALPDEILAQINSRVKQVLPGVKVFLFGSRANGMPTDESDWDILILTEKSIDSKLKREVHDAVFPLSINIGAFINMLIVQESEWLNNPSYYSLSQNVQKAMLQA